MDNHPTFKEKIAQSGVWVTLVMAMFLIILFFVNSIQAQKTQETLDKQTGNTNVIIQQVKELSKQNKKLSEDNKKLNERNTKYAYCNAVLLAKYTQTGAAIMIEDLDNCVLTTFPEGQGLIESNPATSQPSNNNQGSGNTSVTQKPPANNTPSNPSNPNNPNPPSNNPPAQPPGVSLSPSLQIGPTFLTPGINLDAGVGVPLPCIGVPHILRIC